MFSPSLDAGREWSPLSLATWFTTWTKLFPSRLDPDLGLRSSLHKGSSPKRPCNGCARSPVPLKVPWVKRVEHTSSVPLSCFYHALQALTAPCIIGVDITLIPAACLISLPLLPFFASCSTSSVLQVWGALGASSVHQGHHLLVSNVSQKQMNLQLAVCLLLQQLSNRLDYQ